MKILSAKVEWHEQFINYPNLVLEVDALPDLDTMVYTERNGIYYAERQGYATYLYYVQPGEGYGGRKFTLKMKGGTTKTLVGPWSSRAACVNQQGFGPIVDVTFKEGKYSFIAGAVTLRLAQRAMKQFLPDLFLVPLVSSNSEVTYVPSLEAGQPVKWTEPYGGGVRTKQVYDKRGWMNPASNSAQAGVVGS